MAESKASIATKIVAQEEEIVRLKARAAPLKYTIVSGELQYPHSKDLYDQAMQRLHDANVNLDNLRKEKARLSAEQDIYWFLEAAEYQNLAIGTAYLSCRSALEEAADTFRKNHSSSSCSKNISGFSTTNTLKHVEECVDKELWSNFLEEKEPETGVSASAKSVQAWKSLSEFIHNHFMALNSVVFIPDLRSESEKRFLFRLLRKKDLKCRIMLESGAVRDLKPDEMQTPNSSPETAALSNPKSPKKIKLSSSSSSSS